MNKTDNNGKQNINKVGAVMVVGGGICGMQSSLDLANSGFKVYLVEETTSIGGRMAQLDKTFPTNDCSMCMISPKLIEVVKHLNIEILTNSQVQSLSGDVGNFNVKVLKKPRFIDPVKCSACGDCIDVCPVKLPSEFDQGLATRKAIYKRYPQAIPSAMAISKRGNSPCTIACPAHISVQGYVALIAQGKYREALNLIREEIPFPAVCGRICMHPCETSCTRGKVDESVSICHLKRFVSDKIIETGDYSYPKPATSNNKKVAIVGAGPAGLTTACYLAQWGYKTTVFEARKEPGGMLRYGIPAYRLPQEVVEIETQQILNIGVELRTGMKLGRDFNLQQLKSEGFEAVFLALGAQLSSKINIDGTDHKDVLWGLDFLSGIREGAGIIVRDKVVVIGGGNVAVDVALTALRLGAKEVTMACLESREEMPANQWEIAEAISEGVKIMPSWGPLKVLTSNGNVSGIELVKCTSVFDDQKKFCPIFDDNSKMQLEASQIILSIGQRVDLSSFNNGDKLNTNRGLITVNATTLETSIPGVFAGGDVVTGPRFVIEAIAAGKEAAISIDRYLKGEDLEVNRGRKFVEAEAPLEGIERKQRQQIATLSHPERKLNFKEVALNFTEEQARSEAERCLKCGLCSECFQCVAVCQAKAIDHHMTEEELDIHVGSIVLAPGFEPFDASIKGEFGYGRMPNVVTSMDFERILSASGPFQGKVLRPSDGKHAVKIAWIQCVGSRDETCNRDYCSSVCCMYATKEAIIAREHESSIQPTIFHNDIRAFGKGFERYYEAAKNNFGVRYVKGIVSMVKEYQKSHNLLLEYGSEDGKKVQEEFDLVVLSVGIDPSSSGRRMAEKLSIDLNKYGFCQTTELKPNITSRPGIYVAGAFDAPMDIPESVMNASSAAALASADIEEVRGTLITEKEYPPEIDITAQEARVGVFICRCGSNIARVVDVPSVTEYAKSLPNVVFADENLYTCSTDTQNKIIHAIKENNINRVVVASCSPRTHEPLFQDTISEAGLNKYLFEMANIRDQCSWVHATHPKEASDKAKDLVRMAVARASTLEPLRQSRAPVTRRGLVIGGGLAGMTAALGLAEQGFECALIEREKELGGYARHIHYTLHGSDPQPLLSTMLDQVEKEPRIKVYKGASVKEISGYVGNYVTDIVTAGGKTEEIQHGIVIMATGAIEHKPTEYRYGESNDIVTQSGFEEILVSGKIDINKLNTVVMIQCVGSREPDHMYCSRICCSQAVKNAIKIKDINPDAEVYILYRDIRTYGMKELKYREARDKGVTFIRYDVDRKPVVEDKEGKLNLKVFDTVMARDIFLNPDLLILSSAVRPQPDAIEFASKLKLPLTQDGFYMEAHMKLRPLDFVNEGMFLCGLAHSPKFISESIAQARGAVSRAITILSRPYLLVGGVVSVVDPEKCVACLTCVRSCPFGVPKINEEGVAYIEQAACQGCGICAGACPRKAIKIQHYSDRQIMAKSSVLCSA